MRLFKPTDFSTSIFFSQISTCEIPCGYICNYILGPTEKTYTVKIKYGEICGQEMLVCVSSLIIYVQAKIC